MESTRVEEELPAEEAARDAGAEEAQTSCTASFRGSQGESRGGGPAERGEHEGGGGAAGGNDGSGHGEGCRSGEAAELRKPARPAVAATGVVSKTEA